MPSPSFEISVGAIITSELAGEREVLEVDCGFVFGASVRN